MTKLHLSSACLKVKKVGEFSSISQVSLIAHRARGLVRWSRYKEEEVPPISLPPPSSRRTSFIQNNLPSYPNKDLT